MTEPSQQTPSSFQEAVSTVSLALYRVPTLTCANVSANSSNNIEESLSFIPKSFFISWNGVLVLMLQGFPPPLEDFKMKLNDECARLGYKKDNFGSQWAKVTLAAVREKGDSNNNGSGEEVNPLTLEEFHRLKAVCMDCSIPFSETSTCNKTDMTSTMVPIKSISVVGYEWRSLEKLTQVTNLEVAFEKIGGGSFSMQSMKVSPEQQQKTNSVFSEWDDEEAYLSNVNIKGAPYRPTLSNHQNNECNGNSGNDEEDNQMAGTSSSSYLTTPSSSSLTQLGLTCVTFLDLKTCPVVWKCIAKLKNEMGMEFPGRYDWFDEASWHCTIRAMDK